MKAAVLKALGAPLVVEDVAEPVMGTGEVIVQMAATKVLAYAGDVFSGQRQYLMELPIIPGSGGIGRVHALGPDALHLAVGDWVYCDPTVRSRDNALGPDIALLQGLTAAGQGGMKLQKHFHDGSWAERMRVPTENAIALGRFEEAEALTWCGFGTYLVPYGGFDAVALKAGETVVVNGATGAFGSAAVAVALAMGARSVIATGRNQAALDALGRRFGARVRPVRMVVDEEEDRKQILQAAGDPIDVVLDLMPPAASVAQVRAALLTVRPYGRVVLMGGVGEGVAVPYAWLMRNCVTVRGQWMYPREAVHRLIGLVRAGLLRLEENEVRAFRLDEVNDAIAHAASHAGPFRTTAVCP